MNQDCFFFVFMCHGSSDWSRWYVGACKVFMDRDILFTG
jgi:hypothetical protein